MVRKFDLNIEKILDNWEIYHAVREIIANALDEKTLTNTQNIEIFKDPNGKWHIKDYGRGIKYTHFTQNENEEKKKSKVVIGKFGVGLKDALAVLYKNHCSVEILSKYGDITLGMCNKEGFSDTITLHAMIGNPSNPNRIGTEFIIGVSDQDIQKAKSLFLIFTNKKPLDRTNNGEIYEKSSKDAAGVYVHGVKVAEEPMYLFDYNITKTNSTLEKSLNRERSAVGRSAYSNIVMKMLLDAKSNTVARMLVSELKKIPSGTNHDEISRVDIQVHAINVYNEHNNVVFIPSSQSYSMTNNDKEKIIESGREVVIVPDSAFSKIENKKDYSGKEIGTFDTVLREYSENFSYKFIDINMLNNTERTNLDLKDFVFDRYGNQKYKNKIKISENINEMISGDTLGVYDYNLDCIIIKRSVLSDRAKFMEVLFHELVHATTYYPDNNRNFENELGLIIGKLSTELLSSKNKDDKISTIPLTPSAKKETVSQIIPKTEEKDDSVTKQISKKADKRHSLFGKYIK